MLLGQWPAPGGQEGLHEVYTTNHDAPAGGSPSRWKQPHLQSVG